MPAGLRRANFTSKTQALSSSSSITLFCQLQFHHLQNTQSLFLLLAVFLRQVSSSSVSTVHRTFSMSCYHHLQNIQCLFLLIAVPQDRYRHLQCKAHPFNERLGTVQPRSKIRTQGASELTCRAHCFETFVLYVFSFCI